jgi:LCP family protein required for cell wall assembly
MRLGHLLRAATAVAVVVGVGLPACSGDGKNDDLVVGKPKGTSTSTSGPRLLLPPVEVEPPPADLFVDGAADARALPEPGRVGGMAQPDSVGWPAAVPFVSSQPVPEDLVFVLVAGSDARPKEELTKTRADSIHLIALNPKSRQGTILGLPRDSWVEIPGYGRGKINNALALGGPNLLAATVRRTTGLPVHYFVLTGFTGLTRMVDELGGLDIHVSRRMNDKNSGARFERGWHHMTGAEVLAFTRDRTTVANGDFTRSQHHGEVILAALAKMRGEVGDEGGLARWTDVLLRNAKLDVPLADLPALAAFARRLDPARLTNAVAPGRIGMASRQSVVYLTTAAARMFQDLRDDAVLGTAEATFPPDQAPASAASPGPAPPATESGVTTTTGAAPTPDQAPAPDAEAETSTTTGPGFSDQLPLPRGSSSSTSSSTSTTSTTTTTTEPESSSRSARSRRSTTTTTEAPEEEVEEDEVPEDEASEDQDSEDEAVETDPDSSTTTTEP